MIADVLRDLLAGASLTRERARHSLDLLFEDDVPPAQIAAFLTLLQQRGPQAAELAGFADSLAGAAVPVPGDSSDGVDTCGTGGDGHHTFNISTTAAVVAAAAGARVFKHGNRAATSKSGSADLLEKLGVPIELAPADAARCAAEHRFTFLYARAYHPILVKMAPIRSTIGFPTVFNLLGPMLNPAQVRRQVVGVYSAAIAPLYAETLALRGCESGMVIHGAEGLDEATPIGPFRVWRIQSGTVTGEESRDPAELGIARCKLSELQVDGASASEAMARGVLEGRPGGPRDAVLLNSALALEVAAVASNPADAYARSSAAIDDGSALQLLDRLRAFGGSQ